MTLEMANLSNSSALAVKPKLQAEISTAKSTNISTRLNKLKVLDEETYLSEMGKIIERDFFPDLEKLRAQNDYLDALAKNDMLKLRELHAKYSSGRFPLQNKNYASPATFETPLDNRPSEDSSLHDSVVNETDGETLINTEDVIVEKKKKISLDGYLGSHTSEDNQSFQEIIREAEIQHRHKNAWLYDPEESNANSESKLSVPSIEEQAFGTLRPLNLDSWNYRSKNYIMYVPDGVEMTDSEKIEHLSKKQEINHSNTRLAKCPFDETQNKETIQGLAISQSRNLEGKIGVDGKELTFNDTPKVNGFSFVKTPSPAPGVNESPLMTWGNIDGTPFRLDGGDTPLRSSTGPSFKIPEPPKREKLALALAEKAGERHRDRKKKALLAAQRQLASPSPNQIMGSTLERLQSMSPAARRLASTHLKRVGSDHSLIASYSPLRQSSKSGTPTPSSGTPSTSSRHTPLLSTPKRLQNHNLTDNLLNLPKRPRASDYFGS